MSIQRIWAGIRSFTLVEIMITLVITGVLATIAIPAYQNFIEDGRTMMCEKNLESLGREYELYIVEHNVVPGDVSHLPQESIERALARAKTAVGWKEKLVFFLDEQRERGYAFANITQELAKGNLAMLVCPSDFRRNKSGIVSYGFNGSIEGLSKDQYMALDNTTVVMGDSTAATFTNLDNELTAQRHKHISGVLSGSPLSTTIYANGFTRGGYITKIGKSKVIQDLKQQEKNILNSTASRSDRKKRIYYIWHHWR